MKLQPNHTTSRGSYYTGNSEALLGGDLGESLRGRVQLIFTSPPFPLNNKKSYGNLQGDAFEVWFANLAETFATLLTPDGSIVIEMGNSWEPNRPVQSLLHLKSLIGFLENPKADLRLCQQFICHNPSRLPSPAAWVTVKRQRVTDSFTHLWWMAKTDEPKADNRKVLRPYSKSMESLFKRGNYNTERRPSGHQISKKSFLTNNGGSIAQNVFEVESIDSEKDARLPNVFELPNDALSLSNTDSNTFYMRRCRELEVDPHPARMPLGLAAFFTEFLTDPNDIVLDPFAGSNTTGYIAELLDRKWISIEAQSSYAQHSQIRLQTPELQKYLLKGDKK